MNLTPYNWNRTYYNYWGSGQLWSDQFRVDYNQWRVQYTYSCSNVGYASTFVVLIYTVDGYGNLVLVGNPIVSETGLSGANTILTAYGIGTYYVQVNTVCDWNLAVVS